MSEEEREDRGMAYMTPEGHIHPSMGKLDSHEQLIQSIFKAASIALAKIEGDINKHPERIDLHIVNSVGDMVDFYNDHSAAKEGMRSKQIAKIGSSNAYAPTEEDKRGWIQRHFTQRKKEEVASEG